MTDRPADPPLRVAAPIEPKQLPIPRWLIRTIWSGHRIAYAITAGRFGLRSPTADRYGMLRLTTTGRRTGGERHAILAYVEDETNLVLMAMNGWADPEPAWWLNLQAHPEARVELPDGPRTVTARMAYDDERRRLWSVWDRTWSGDLDAWAANRSRQTQLIILETRKA